MTAEDSRVVAVKARGAFIVLWAVSSTGDSVVTKLPCVSEDHATELAAVANRAFGIRSVENSFTTGLLHKDLEIACGL